MKKIVAPLLVILLTTVTVFASAKDLNKLFTDVEQRASKETRELQQVVNFNEYEYIQIKKLTENKIKALQEIKLKHGADEKLLGLLNQKADEEYKSQVATILSEKQRIAFVAFVNQKSEL